MSYYYYNNFTYIYILDNYYIMLIRCVLKRVKSTPRCTGLPIAGKKR